jgi:signal transduction histidine kinase
LSTQVHILVVDDDEAGRYVKAHVLRRAGFRVAEATSGTAAVEACAASPQPDLVVLDTRLPGMSGSEACRRIKAAYPHIAILQVTAALSSGQDRAAALEGGADGFLVEPIEPEELLASIGALLRMRRAEQELRRVNEHLEEIVAARTEELAVANRRLTLEIGERERMEEMLRHTQKMEAIGQLTGGIAHDFNNLLAVIAGALGMLRGSVEGRRDYSRERQLRLLSAAETAVDRGTKVTRQLLAFARRTVLSAQAVVLDEVLAIHASFLRRALGEAVELTIDGPADLWPCRVDPVQFEAAALNLIVNARDAMPDGGRLSITTANVTIAGGEPGTAGLAPGDYVRVRIADTGTGMPPAVAQRIFEPFFTTKEVGRGTGLGLSQVYGFVAQSGGRIDVETAIGAGTTFTIHLPRSEAPPLSLATEEGEAPIATGGGNETVLVVEDHPDVRELAVMAISDLGYQVLAAANGPSALDVLRSEAPVDLLFTDVVMPGGINGFELVRRARKLRQGIRTLITTGYAAVRDHEALAAMTVLAKPYTRSELAKGLREALRAPD